MSGSGVPADLSAWLEGQDAATRPERAARLRVVVQEVGPDSWQMFPGGDLSPILYEEARLAFVQGLFLACVFLCQAFVEHTLSGLFRMAGDDTIAGGSYYRLLREARGHRYLLEAEFDLFDRLRRQRNPYTHGSPPGARDHHARRALASDATVHELLERDATAAVKGIMALMARVPFAHG